MKTFLSVILSLLVIPAFSQQTTISHTADTSDIPPVISKFQTYGYIDGVRLDSINTQYAEFFTKGIDGIGFNYGQNPQKRKDASIKDRQGVPLMFLDRSTAFMLNFFYYNGWELANSYNTYPNEVRIILKKISN